MLSKKEREILVDLLSGNTISYKLIANKYSVSNRSARYYIENIDYLLTLLGYRKISKNKNEISLNINQNFDKLSKFFYDTVKLSQTDRILILKLNLFFNNKGLNISKLSKKIGVSRTTVKKDLKKISEEFKASEILVSYKKSAGYRLKGVKNKILVKGINLLNKLIVSEDYLSSSSVNIVLENYLLEYVTKEMQDTVKKFIFEVEGRINLNINTQNYGNILSYLIILIYFNKNPNFVFEKNSYSLLVQTEDYRKIEELFIKTFSENKKIPEEILLKVIDLLMGLTIDGSNDFFNDWIDQEFIIKKMIVNVSKSINFDLTTDHILLSSLLCHIKPTIYRIKNNIEVSSPVFRELIIDKDPMLTIVKKSVKEMEELFNLEFSENEIAILSYHFKGALDRNKVEEMKKVILVYSLGYGTSKVLEQSLKINYNFEVVDTIPFHLVDDSLKLRNVDFILTTVNLKGDFNVPVIKINPLIKDEDFTKLSLFGRRKVEKKISLGELLTIIKKYSKIIEEGELINKIRVHFSDFIDDDLSNTKGTLKKFLNINNFKVINSIDSWEEAIRIAGEMLITENKVSPPYVDKMISLVKKHGAYIVIEDGLAIPHAGMSKDVLDTGISLLIVKNDVLFNEFRKAKIFLTFSTKTKKAHIDILNNLFELIIKHDFIKKVSHINSYNELIDYFENIK